MLKRIAVLLSVCFLLINCASTNSVSAQPNDIKSNDIQPNAPPKYIIIPESPVPGEAITVAVNKVIKDVQLMVNGKQTAKASSFFMPAEKGNPGFFAAIITIPCTVDPQDAVIKINNESGVFMEIPIKIADRKFLSETLNLTPSLTSLVADPNPQRQVEEAYKWELVSKTNNEVYHAEKFVMPIEPLRTTSEYGTRRINAYSDGRRTTSIHAGIDFAVYTGTPVLACGRAKVVMSRLHILTGNSIILEHAPGVYTIYYHLDKLIAEEGSIVNTGDRIGLSGSTGFSTGPHLHWEMRVSTENTDPDIFLSRTLLDKNLIISKLFR